jgi:membrane protein
MAAMFHFVPNTFVRWGHAWMGGLFVSSLMEVAKKLLAIYLSKVPTYSAVYGAFATLPILLVWIYMAWVIVLLGAALTAYVPSLIAGIPRRRSGHGWQFQLALEVLRELDLAATLPEKGRTMAQLCITLAVDAQRVETAVEALTALDWIGLLNEADVYGAEARYVLLVQPERVNLEPLLQALLLPRNDGNEKLWQGGHWPASTLRAVL